MSASIDAASTAGTGERSFRQVYERRVAAKIIAEFCHEQALAPLETGRGQFTLFSDDRRTEYTFAADLLALDSWAVDESSIRRVRSGADLPVSAAALVVDLHEQLGITHDKLPDYLEELVHTIAIGA
ncbi:MAG: IucA/IucC family protein, partial [Gordonia sp. (in: high G+C Gram-positive bacteria)]